MATSIVFTVFITIFPSAKSLDTLPLSSGSQEPDNIYHEYSSVADVKHQRGLIPENQYHISKIQPNDRTAFRKIQNSHRERYNENDDVTDTNRTVDDISKTNYRRKKNRESSIDPTNVTFNDWETFITDSSKLIPQYVSAALSIFKLRLIFLRNLNRRHATLRDYEAIHTNNMSNQFLKESIISSPSEYIPSIRKMQPSGVTRNPFDYQQLATNFNSVHEIMPNEAETAERLPPPPNTKSTEASVHTVKVYPPSQQPSSIDYQGKSIYENNIPNSGNYQKYSGGYGRRGRFEQSIPQLMSNNYNVDAAYLPEGNPDCTTDPCEINTAYPFGSTEDERCNSPRLKQIILQNIMERDAETSKQAIYNVCEAEMEVPCNVICGTGFYSYVARASQFCLVSAMDISCYAFIPACEFDSNLTVKRWAKKRSAKV
ncbi:unnamed protein product [Onchocerca flexuosa]|uniref:Ground-like domain-containing protein n=1 Tax=Onchocerca flexuosa TaxID=387005 RepID=A0A183H774_9BILA|nr:unnamed protein product [Onchocerca flexuosa]